MRIVLMAVLAAAASPALAQGVQVESLRLSAAGMLIDARLRVVDAGQAAPLFAAANAPRLVLPDGSRLEVAAPAKVGPLRAKGKPEEGRSYFVLFGNGDRRIKAGQKVEMVVGGNSLGTFTVEE